MDNKMIILVKKPSPQQMMLEDNVNKPDLLSDEELMHFGVLGMKWGVRRYQNKDGTLTALGKAHLATLRATNPKKARKFEIDALKNTEIIKKQNAKKRKKSLKKAQKALKEKKYHESDKYKKKMAKKAAKAQARKEKFKYYMSNGPDKDRLKKKYVKQGPGVVARHVDLFTDRELQEITRKYDWENRLKQQKLDKSSKNEETIKRLIRMGGYANDAIKWYNSSAGKSLRQLLGDPTFYKNKLNWSPYYGKKKKDDKK